MSPARYRLPPDIYGGRGVLQQNPDGSWSQEEAGPDEDVSGLTLVGKEALSDFAMDSRLGGPPNAADPALQRVRVRQATPAPTQPAFESLMPYAPGGPKSAQEGPQQPAAATIAPGAMGNAARAVGDGVMGGAHGGGGPAAPSAMPPAIAELLERARQDARSRRLAAALGRSGAVIGSGIARLGGGRGEVDEAGFAAMAQEAERPMVEGQQRAAEAMAAQQHAQQMGSARALRAIVGSMMPDLPPEALEQADPATLLKVVELARKGDEASRKAAHELVMERIGMARAGASMANAQATRELARSNKLETDVQKLGKDVQGLADIEADIRHLEQVANTPDSEDIPGIGVADSRMPDWALSQQGLQNRQATMRAVVNLLHAFSGAAVTPQEAERFMASRGWGMGAPEKAWKAGVRAFLRDAVGELQAKQAKYRPEVVETLRERGGFTADKLERPAGQQAPAGAGGRRVVKDKNGRVLGFINPDGTEELVGG